MKKFFAIILIFIFLPIQFTNASTLKACPKSKLNKTVSGFTCKKINGVYRWAPTVALKPPVVKEEKPTTSTVETVKELEAPKSSTEITNSTQEVKTMTLEEANILKVSLDPRNMTECTTLLDRISNSQGELLCMQDQNGKLKWHQNFNIKLPITSNGSSTANNNQNSILEIDKLYNKITLSVSNFNKSNVSINAIYSPTVNRDAADTLLLKYKESIKLYSSFITKNITIVLISESDYEWWRSTSASLEGSSADLSWWTSGHCPITSMSFCGYGTNSVPYALFYAFIGSKSTFNNNNEININHEAVHVYQKSIFNNPHPTCWITEGHANALGLAISSKTMDVKQNRQNEIERISNMYPGFKTYNKQQWVDVLKTIDLDRTACFKNGMGYSLGMLIVESLFDKYDFEMVTKMFVAKSNENSLDSALRSSIGISEDEFYSVVAEYLVKNAK
jgi:hypothetical protein